MIEPRGIPLSENPRKRRIVSSNVPRLGIQPIGYSLRPRHVGSTFALPSENLEDSLDFSRDYYYERPSRRVILADNCSDDYYAR